MGRHLIYQDDSPFTHCPDCGEREHLHLIYEEEPVGTYKAHVWVKCENCNKMLSGIRQELRGSFKVSATENESEVMTSVPCVAMSGELDTDEPGAGTIEIIGGSGWYEDPGPPSLS